MTQLDYKTIGEVKSDRLELLKTFALLLGLLLLFGLAGTMDYAAQRGAECERDRLVWDLETDQCVSPR